MTEGFPLRVCNKHFPFSLLLVAEIPALIPAPQVDPTGTVALQQNVIRFFLPRRLKNVGSSESLSIAGRFSLSQNAISGLESYAWPTIFFSDP